MVGSSKTFEEASSLSAQSFGSVLENWIVCKGDVGPKPRRGLSLTRETAHEDTSCESMSETVGLAG